MLRETERRYEPRQWAPGVWRVYDRQRASYPGQRPDVGLVAQDLRTKIEAQVEADRCEKTRSKEKK